MKQKHILIFLAIFLVLGAINFIQKIYSSKTSLGEVRHEEWRPMIPQDKVARILFSRKGHSALALVKEGKNWKVETLSGVGADSQKVRDLLSQLNQLKAELRAEGEGLYERFGIGDQRAFRIQILNASGAAMIDFWMAEHRAGRGVFIRLAGTEKIYFTADDVPALFGLFADLEQSGPQPLFFTDLKLVPESFESIQRFDVTEIRDGKSFSLAALERPSSQAGTPWQFVSKDWKYSPELEKVESYLGRLLGAHAESIATKIPEFKKEMEIMLRDTQGKVLRLQLMKAAKTGQGDDNDRSAPNEWLVRRESETPLFQISDLTFEDLKSEDARFVVENPLQLALDEENIVELIHDGKTETFSKASGGASAIAILDAAAHLQFLGVDQGARARDLSILPPTHQLRVTRSGSALIEMGFYVTDPKLTEIKTVISGQDFIFRVSREFFESIFVPAAPPKGEAPLE